MYVPLITAYESGSYIGIKEFEAPTATEAECKTRVAREIAQISQTAPPDAQLIGICPAIPKADVPTPEQPKVSRGQDSTT